MFWWVIQESEEKHVAHGPYKSKQAAEHRFDKVGGCRCHLFRCNEEDPNKAVEAFRFERNSGD